MSTSLSLLSISTSPFSFIFCSAIQFHSYHLLYNTARPGPQIRLELARGHSYDIYPISVFIFPGIFRHERYIWSFIMAMQKPREYFVQR